MRYVKSSQIVPGKGMAWTYYEVDDAGTVLRQLTHIDGSDEFSLVPDPIVKKLMRPELCEESDEKEFHYLWKRGEEA